MEYLPGATIAWLEAVKKHPLLAVQPSWTHYFDSAAKCTLLDSMHERSASTFPTLYNFAREDIHRSLCHPTPHFDSAENGTILEVIVMALCACNKVPTTCASLQAKPAHGGRTADDKPSADGAYMPTEHVRGLLDTRCRLGAERSECGS